MLYSIDLSKTPIKTSIEVNSCFYHYNPSLGTYKNDILVVIGGVSSKKCEYYSIINQKWKSLPDLPENRYGCSVYNVFNSNYVYIFGGYDSEAKKCCMSIFKINMNICVKWDTLIILENSDCLAKYNSVIIKKRNGHIWILGGSSKYLEDNNENTVNSSEKNKKNKCEEFSVVDIDFNSKIFKPEVLSTKYYNIHNYFSLNRVGEESKNESCYFFSEEENNMYSNVYEIDNQGEKIIRINKSI